MDEVYIRPDSLSTLSLYRGDRLLVRGLTSEDAREFCRIYASLDGRQDGSRAADKEGQLSRSTEARVGTAVVRKRGRKLVLQDHVETIRSMVEENPRTTTRDVEVRLRRSGVKFASNSAIRNVAKSFNIGLSA